MFFNYFIFDNINIKFYFSFLFYFHFFSFLIKKNLKYIFYDFSQIFNKP